MKTLKKLLARYSHWIQSVLAPLGPWGVFAIAAVDGSFMGLPLDFIFISYVYSNRSRFLLFVLMASAGSVLGSCVLYLIGYLGGEALLRKRMPEEGSRRCGRAQALRGQRQIEHFQAHSAVLARNRKRRNAKLTQLTP